MNSGPFSQNSVNPGINVSIVSDQPHGRRKNRPIRPIEFYDLKWAEKPSTNGKFKYGLFECCSGPNGESFIPFVMICTLFMPCGYIYHAMLDGEIADAIGKNKFNQ